ncbi:MAG: hypothetical protein JSU68_05575 [Phycisphaerales bacterium]|nr:MAG: hypothetical protein JSU68_05575 [Phycisphaerales bacterium]
MDSTDGDTVNADIVTSRCGLCLREYVWAGVVLAAVALIHTWPIFVHFDNWGIEDWDQHFFYHAVPRATVLEHGQIPLWNPYYCGGAPLLANPQSRICSPTFPIILIFDVVRGLKIEIWVNLVIGLLGTYVLARHLGIGGAAAFLVPSVYLLSTMYSLILTSGSTNFLSVAYLPWTVWTFLRSLHNLRWCVAAGAFLALTYLTGGHWVVPIVALFLAVLAVCSIVTHGLRRSAAALALTGLLSIGLASVKLISSLQMMSAYPRSIRDYSGYSLAGLHHMLLDRDQTLPRFLEFGASRGFLHGLSGEMTENGMYIGVLSLILVCVGLGVQARRQWKWTLALVLFLWLCLGSRAPLSLWDWLHRLPVYDHLQMASRFRIVFLLAAAVFAGWGLRWVDDTIRRRTGRRVPAHVVVWLLTIAVVADLVLVTRPIFASAFPIEPAVVMDELEPSAEFTQILRLPAYGRDGFRDDLDWFDTADINDVPVDVSYSAMYPAFLNNLGSVWSYEAIPIPAKAQYRGSPGYRGEVFMNDIRGSARITMWSPNRIAVAVDALAEDRVVINQNFSPGWKADGADGPAGPTDEGLLSAPVTPATTQVVFYYRPFGFTVGVAITLLTAVGCLLYLLRTRRAPPPDPKS